MVGSGARPLGGFRVVYEYANRLVGGGHQVTLLHAPYSQMGWNTMHSFPVYMGKRLGLRGGPAPTSWFKLDSRIKLVWRPSLASRYVPDADVVVATAWETAEWVVQYPPEKGRKYYLIQLDERILPKAKACRVTNTYTMPLTNLVISKTLQNLVTEVGGRGFYMPNGLNDEDFGLDTPIEERDSLVIAMPYRKAAHKGSTDGLRALRTVSKHHPISVRLFGFEPAPLLEPGWTYVSNPSRVELRALFNASAVFVSMSRSEGWGLPPCEAAQCGVALAVTDIGGHSEWAQDGVNALLSQAGDWEAMAASVSTLIENQTLRWRLAKAGLQTMKRFSWEAATSRMEAVLKGDTDPDRRLEGGDTELCSGHQGQGKSNG